MSIKISKTNLIPVRRDKQISSISISGGASAGGSSGGGSSLAGVSWSGDTLVISGNVFVSGDTRAYGDVMAYSSNEAPINWWDSLPTASASVKGGVKVGSGLTITDGVLSANGITSIPLATTSAVGGIQLNGSTTQYLNGNGQWVAGGGGSQWVTSGNDIYYNTGGVAIGSTSADGRTFKVTGNMTVTQGAVINDIKVNRSTGGANYPNYPDIYATSGGIVIGGLSNGTGTVSFSTTGSATTPSMHITTSGNVGIGTTAPVLNTDLSGPAEKMTLPANSGSIPSGFVRIGYSDHSWNGTELNFGIHNYGSYPAWIQAQVPGNYSVNRPLWLNPNGGDVSVGASLNVGGNLSVGPSNAGGTINSYLLSFNATRTTGNNFVFNAYNKSEALAIDLNGQITHKGSTYLFRCAGGGAFEDLGSIKWGNVGNTAINARIWTRRGGNNYGQGALVFETSNNDAGPVERMRIHETGTVSINGNLTVGGEVTSYYSSDVRLKQNIKPITSALDTIQKLQPVTYNWNDKAVELNDKKDTTTNQFGLIAQELEKVAPELVHNIYNEYKAIDYTQIIPILIQAIKEQQIQIDELKKK